MEYRFAIRASRILLHYDAVVSPGSGCCAGNSVSPVAPATSAGRHAPRRRDLALHVRSPRSWNTGERSPQIVMKEGIVVIWRDRRRRADSPATSPVAQSPRSPGRWILLRPTAGWASPLSPCRPSTSPSFTEHRCRGSPEPPSLVHPPGRVHGGFQLSFDRSESGRIWGSIQSDWVVGVDGEARSP